MQRTSLTVGCALMLGMTVLSLPARAVNKCTAPDGTVSFQDAPCPEKSKKAEKIKPREASGGFEHPFARRGGAQTDAETVIRSKCIEEWPNDFRMQAYCEKKQYEALQKLQKAPAASPQAASIIREKCASEWPSDFRMRAYCEQKQVEALRELGTR